MKFLLLILFTIPLTASPLSAQQAPAANELTNLLKEFLAGASDNNIQIHDRFWADDLIYTSSSGIRMEKKDIMNSLKNPADSNPDEPSPLYSAEDIQIQQYNNTAIVAFRLVSVTNTGESTEILKYLNSGTFLKRNGKWQVVNWQATKIP